MNIATILDTAQYVVNREGQHTAVLLDLASWESLRQLLEELAEDEHLGQLLAAAEGEETLTGEAAHIAYQIYLAENSK